MFIYRIINKITNKTYIGKTVRRLDQRFTAHIIAVKRGSNTKLHNAIRKYGKDNFTIEVIEVVNDQTLLNEREQFYIQSLNPEYNMTIGGDGGDTSLSPNYQKNHFKNCLRGPEHPRYGKTGKSSPVYGRKHRDNTLIAMSTTHRELRQSRKLHCNYCHRDIDFANYKRWHNTKCKNYSDSPLNVSLLTSCLTPPEI